MNRFYFCPVCGRELEENDYCNGAFSDEDIIRHCTCGKSEGMAVASFATGFMGYCSLNIPRFEKRFDNAADAAFMERRSLESVDPVLYAELLGAYSEWIKSTNLEGLITFEEIINW